jgi:hypothetical protein
MPNSNFLVTRKPKDELRSWRGQISRLGALRLESCIWIGGCLVAFFGVLKAAYSEDPLIWLLVWPVPVAFACTIFIFLRRGFHFQNGVLVLGRRRG